MSDANDTDDASGAKILKFERQNAEPIPFVAPPDVDSNGVVRGLNILCENYRADLANSDHVGGAALECVRLLVERGVTFSGEDPATLAATIQLILGANAARRRTLDRWQETLQYLDVQPVSDAARAAIIEIWQTALTDPEPKP